MANLVHWGFKRRNKPECWTKVFLNLGTISEVHLRGLFVVRLACDLVFLKVRSNEAFR